MVTEARVAALQASGLNVAQGPTGTTVGTAPASAATPSSSLANNGASPVGSTARTNELLGGNYFNTTTGSQIKPFTPSTSPVQANEPTSPIVVTSDKAQNDLGKITKFASDVKSGMANQAANNASAGQTPNIPGYTVSTNESNASGVIPIKTNGTTYYAVPNGGQISAEDVKQALMGTGESEADATKTALGAENTSYQSQISQNLSDTETAYNNFNNAVTQIRSGAFQLSPAQQALIDSTNTAFNTMLSSAGLKAAAISSETGGFSNKVSSMMGVMANIETQQAAAIAKLEQGFQDDNYKYIKDAYDEFNTLETKKTDALSAMHKDVVDQLNTAIAQQQKTQDNVDAIAQDAAKNGADAKTISAIRSSKDVGEAIGNAGDYLQTATGQQADYLWYKRNAEANGQVPQDYTTWKAADDAQQAKLKANEAYATAYATESAKQAADAKYSGTDVVSPVAAQTGAAAGLTFQAPDSIAPYVNFSASGVKYVDLSKFAGTPTEKNKAVNAAQASGYKVILDPSVANDVQNITDASAKLNTIKNAFDQIGASSAGDRILYQAAFTKMAKAFQTDPKVVASGVYEDAALDILKALSGTKGFRGNQSMIEKVQETFPSATDTKAVVDAKIKAMNNLMTDRETALVGKPSASDQALIDANKQDDTLQSNLQNVKNTNPSLFNSASAMYTSINPATGSPYTAQDILSAFPELAQ